MEALSTISEFLIQILILVALFAINLLRRRFEGKRDLDTVDTGPSPDAEADAGLGFHPDPLFSLPASAWQWDPEMARTRIADMRQRAEELLESARIDPATRRVAVVIDDYLLPQLARALSAVDDENSAAAGIDHDDAAGDPADDPAIRALMLYQRLESLHVVATATEVLVKQRRDPRWRKQLGDADEIARACYEPLLDFARANRFELSSADPVTIIGPFELGLWTGFIPTGVAPLFLPPRFFRDIRWWPAVAHEIGHDFLAATTHAEDRMRAQFGLLSENGGQDILSVNNDAGGLQASDLRRLLGVWFEEIFCDLVGVMMMGPAYGHTMVSLFAEPHAPQHTATVATTWGPDHLPHYDEHPPRLLRVQLCAHALQLLGEDAAGRAITAEWAEIHGEQDALWLPVQEGVVGIPVEVFFDMAAELVTSLYRDGNEGLDGHALRDIPGLDYGPHIAAEIRRVQEALVIGQSPNTTTTAALHHSTRAIVAGAVLAWHSHPARSEEFIEAALTAIIGAADRRSDYDKTRPGHRGPRTRSAEGPDPAFGLQAAPVTGRDALILHTIMAPPRSVAHLRPTHMRGGMLEPKQWPPNRQR